jgi:hypothetical protein
MILLLRNYTFSNALLKAQNTLEEKEKLKINKAFDNEENGE